MTVKLDVIATYETKGQEFFIIKMADEHLETEDTILAHVIAQLDHPQDLVKLSLSWVCTKETVAKYPAVEDSILDYNGKYFFEQGKLVDRGQVNIPRYTHETLFYDKETKWGEYL